MCIDCLEEAWHIGLGVGDRLGATPFGETLNDPVVDVFGGMNRLELFAKGRRTLVVPRQRRLAAWFLVDPHVASVLMLSTARAIRGRMFFPLNELRAHCADAGGVLRHSAAAAQWKIFESSSADVTIDAPSVAGREAIMGGMQVQDDLSMDVVKEGGRLVGSDCVVA